MSYVEVHNKCKDKTSVWYYFLQRADKLKAKCKLCPGPGEREIATAGSSTSGLVKHLLAIHKIALKSPGSAVSPLAASTSQEPPAKKRQTIQDFFQPAKPTMAVRITRLVAVDGIAMRVVVTSQDLRAGLAALHSLPPKHPATIRKTILDHVKELRLSMRACFEALKAKGIRFSLTIDEWTSSANRRYLNVTLCSPVELPNGSVMCNLGLQRLTGSVTAEVCLEALKEKLLQFGLSLNSDILGCASDGAAVMVKLGKLMEGAIGQLCFAHAIHNGICEILYKKRLSPTPTEEPSLEGVSVNEDVEDDENDAFVVNLQPVAQEGTADLNEEFYDVISKVRKVVKLFKKSPTSNEKFLQKYVLEEHKNDLALQLDCKTRWNSLCTMVERFVLLASCVKKALIDMRLTLSFTDSELLDLEKLVNFLKPALLSVEALCRRDANLLTADAALEFLFKKLDASESSFGIRLREELKSRIGKRRSSISTLLQVLHSASYDFKIEDQLEVPRPSNAALKRLTITLLQRLFETPAELEADKAEEDSTDNEVDDPPIQPVTLEMELEQALSVARKSKTQGTSESSSNFEAILSKEWNLHQSGGGRGRLLDKLYKSLLGIPPTSVESERAFSAAGTIVRPLRTRLGDNMVDALSFARFHYTIKK